MNKKHNLLKMFFALVCLAAVTFFALVEAGADMPLVRAYKNNFKKNIRNIADLAGIELSIETQLYLDDNSTPPPKPTMIPADEQQALNDALGYPVPEESGDSSPKIGSAGLTTKAPEKLRDKSVPIAFDSAENSRFKCTAEGILCVNETTYAAYTENGKLRWKDTIQIQKPYIESKNGYVLISGTGDKKISLYKGKKQLYITELGGNIICAGMNRHGDVVAVTQKEYYKAQVAVLNKSGKIIFAWDSGSYDILDAAISDNRSVALAMLNTDSGAASFVTCLDVNGKTKYKTDSFDDTLIFDVEYAGGKLNAIADNRCMAFNSGGKKVWEYSYDGKNLARYHIAENGYKVLAFSTEGMGKIVTLSTGGKVKGAVDSESVPDWIDIKSNYLAYNSGRDVMLSSFDGKTVYKSSCEADIKQLHIASSGKLLCVYSSSIQVKKPDKVKKINKEAQPETVAPDSVDVQTSAEPQQ